MERQLLRNGLTLSVDERDLDTLITARIDKLSELVNEKYKFVEANKFDLIAHLALRMISATDENGRVETWFLNNEGAALRLNLAYIRNNNYRLFIGLLKKLLFCDTVMSLKDFCHRKLDGDENALRKTLGIAINNDHLVMNWYAIPSIIRKSGCIVYNGYAIVKKEVNGLITQAVRNYELMLRRKIYTLAGTVTVEKIDYYNKFAQRLLKHIRETSTSFVGMENLEEEIKFFPPCIAGLDAKISQGFQVEHLEYLQLGFFLREAGMSFKDYQRYWYFRHPKNRSKSWEDFSTSHWGDYQLRFHFGHAGGGKEYRAYGCKKAQSDAFCPFKDYKGKELGSFLLSYLEKEYETEEEKEKLKKEIKHILSLVRKRHYGAACAIEYQLRFKKGKIDWVNHPIISYYQKIKREVKKQQKMIIQRTKKQAPQQVQKEKLPDLKII